jgi:hypothetical protein
VRVLYCSIEIGIVERALCICTRDCVVEWNPVLTRRLQCNGRQELVMTRLASLLRVPALLALLEHLDAAGGGFANTDG